MTDIIGPANASGAVTERPADTRADFGVEDTWFKDCTSSTVDDGTDITAGWLNKIVAVLRNAIRINGSTGAGAKIVDENDTDDALLAESIQHLIQRGKPNYAVASGTGDALVVTLSPAPAELVAGMEIRLLTGVSNTTTTPTIKVNEFDAATIMRADGTALRKGDLVIGENTLRCDGAAFRLMNSPAADNAVNLVVSIFDATNTWIVPAGVNFVQLEAWGAGGGGGSGDGTHCGLGGGGGAYGAGYYAVTPGATLNINIGAGGTGANAGGNAGANGGTTSVAVNGGSTLISVAGGQGGPGVTTGSASSGGQTGAGYDELIRGFGGFLSAPFTAGSPGGGSARGAGYSQPGNGGTVPGGGGSGNTPSNTYTKAGIAGADGRVKITYAA